MCVPAVVIGVAAIGLQIAGGVMRANAAKQQAEAAAQGNLADARYYEHLAGGAVEQAGYVRATAKKQVDIIATGAAGAATATRQKGERILGAQRAGFAAAGVGAGSVTAMDVALDTLEREQQDEELIRYNANVAAWDTNNQATITAEGLLTQAEGYRMGAASSRRAAETAREAGNIGLWESIIGGAAGAAQTGVRMAYYA